MNQFKFYFINSIQMCSKTTVLIIYLYRVWTIYDVLLKKN